MQVLEAPEAAPRAELAGAGPAAPRARRGAQHVLIALLLIVLAAAAFSVGLRLSGVRWFVVETPSMGTTAPVGTLVVTAPTRAARVGDVIAFRPPAVDRVYTHRVVAVTPSGSVRTRGDLNGADDGWDTPPDRVVGRAIAIVPAAGFLARAVPLLIGGALLVWWIAGVVRRPDLRAAIRVTGMHLVASLVILYLHPLASISLLATASGPHGLHASVVSTGLLPIRLTGLAGQQLARLRDGQLASVPVHPSSAGHLAVTAVPDLTGLQHLLLIGLTLLPAAFVLLIGLPRVQRDAAEDDLVDGAA